MLHRFQRGGWRHLLVALGGLHLMGGPLVILQLVAWAGMMVSYSIEDGLTQGVRDTFSGERPCALCRCIESIDEKESPPALPSTEGQRRLAEGLGQSLRTPEVIDVPAPRDGEGSAALVRSDDCQEPESLRGSPETPPPRGVG